jgi:hypothetical protein
MTECNQTPFHFANHFRREVVAGFDGGTISSEAGSLLLRQVEQSTGMLWQFANCFRDYRDADKIEHSVRELIGQWVYGIALGYEDLNDHDQLRRDPLLAVLREARCGGAGAAAGTGPGQCIPCTNLR